MKQYKKADQERYRRRRKVIKKTKEQRVSLTGKNSLEKVDVS